MLPLQNMHSRIEMTNKKMVLRWGSLALCISILFSGCVKDKIVSPVVTTIMETTDVPLTGMPDRTTAADTTAPMPTKPTLTLDPVTTATETITLYLYNGTGETICTIIKAREIQEVYRIEKLVDGEWQKVGSRMAELRGASSTYQIKEVHSIIDHEPGETTTYTIPVKAWCSALLTPGEYRVPIKYGNFFDPELYVDAWYFTVTE